MDTYQIEIIEPKAKKLLEELVNLNLIKFRRVEPIQQFQELVQKIRAKEAEPLSLEEITAEVELVRGAAHATFLGDDEKEFQSLEKENGGDRRIRTFGKALHPTTV